MSILTTSFQQCVRNPRKCNKRRKIIKDIKIKNEKGVSFYSHREHDSVQGKF